MMIPQTLTPEPSNQSLVRSDRGAPSVAWWIMGVLAGALACTGTIDATEQPPLSGSSTSPGKTGTASDTSATPNATTGRAPRETPAAVGGSEADNGNVRGVDDESSSGRRRGGGGRAAVPDRNDDEQIDAGLDAGEADAGEIVQDAGEVDAGVVVDAGPAADAAAP